MNKSLSLFYHCVCVSLSVFVCLCLSLSLSLSVSCTHVPMHTHTHTHTRTETSSYICFPSDSSSLLQVLVWQKADITLNSYSYSSSYYTFLCWEVQAGFLAPLTFAQHRLSPLAALPTLKVVLEAHRMCLATSNNLLLVLYRMPQNAFFSFFLSFFLFFLFSLSQTRNLLVSQKTTQRHFFPTFHTLSPVIFATATVVAFVLFRNSRFKKQRLFRNRPGSDAATSCDVLCERLQRALTCANQLH